MRENKRAARATRSYGKHLRTDKQPRQMFVLFVLGFFVLFRRNVAKLLEKRQKQHLGQSFPTSWGEREVTLPYFRKLRMLGCERDFNNQQAFTFMSSRFFFFKRCVYLIVPSYCPLFALMVLHATNWKQNRSALGLECLSFLRVTRASRLSAAVSLSVCP